MVLIKGQESVFAELYDDIERVNFDIFNINLKYQFTILFY